VGDISKALVDLAMLPIPRIPWDPGRASDVLKVAGAFLWHLQDSYASGIGP
jgi:hypothetical protein